MNFVTYVFHKCCAIKQPYNGIGCHRIKIVKNLLLVRMKNLLNDIIFEESSISQKQIRARIISEQSSILNDSVSWEMRILDRDNGVEILEILSKYRSITI